eukprot:5892637-Pyramimonas_sp.AAC.1
MGLDRCRGLWMFGSFQPQAELNRFIAGPSSGPLDAWQALRFLAAGLAALSSTAACHDYSKTMSFLHSTF